VSANSRKRASVSRGKVYSNGCLIFSLARLLITWVLETLIFKCGFQISWTSKPREKGRVYKWNSRSLYPKCRPSRGGYTCAVLPNVIHLRKIRFPSCTVGTWRENSVRCPRFTHLIWVHVLYPVHYAHTVSSLQWIFKLISWLVFIDT